MHHSEFGACLQLTWKASSGQHKLHEQGRENVQDGTETAAGAINDRQHHYGFDQIDHHEQSGSNISLSEPML
jgi:hypothetical protein